MPSGWRPRRPTSPTRKATHDPSDQGGAGIVLCNSADAHSWCLRAEGADASPIGYDERPGVRFTRPADRSHADGCGHYRRTSKGGRRGRKSTTTRSRNPPRPGRPLRKWLGCSKVGFTLSQYISRPSIIAAWCFILGAALWIMSATASVIGTMAVVIIGLTPAMMFLVLARRPEPAMAEVLRAVDAGGSE